MKNGRRMDMPRLAKPINAGAANRADEEFYRRHPDRKSRPLTSPHDTHLINEWLELYRRYGGNVQLRARVNARSGITTVGACMQPDKKFLEVYVYLVEMSGGDPWGHVGLILQQKDGTYVRYSQAAKNSNLHGLDRLQYVVEMQPALVRRHPGKSVKDLSAGGKVIRIPTEHPEQVQKAVDKYIAHESHYSVIRNDCAEFVNEVLVS
jgi:hypothetical protein